MAAVAAGPGADILTQVSTLRPTLARHAVRALAVVAVGTLVLIASPALADVPSGWPDPEPVPLLRALLVYVGAPLGLMLIITLLVMAPSMARGERPGASATDDQWFGGPRGGTRELEADGQGTTPSATSGTGPGTTTGTTTGGASGGW